MTADLDQVLINILQVWFRLKQVPERFHWAIMEEHNHLEKITLKTLSAFLHADTVEAIGSVMQVLKIFLCNLSVMSTTEMCALLRFIENESGPLQFHLMKIFKAYMAIYHEVPLNGNTFCSKFIFDNAL